MAGTQPGGSGAQAVANVRHLTLRAMPAGTVRFGRDRNGGLIARINMYGLTPGSTHTIEIQVAGRVNPVVPFVPLTADGMGRLHATAVSNWKGRSLPAGSRFVIRLGLHGGDGNINPVAAEPLARTIPLPRTLRDSVYRLSAVDFAPNGVSAGRLRGRATVSYNPLAHTLTVAVNAGGLTPGAHAAHIHSGTCMNQGGVLYMMADLVADKDGFIHQVRIISGVMTAPPATGWYLNIHQGDSNSILTANKTPSLAFRPLLCANI
jgi:Cu/Zn superoxide dismutase